MKEMAKKVRILEPLIIENIPIKKDHYFPKAFMIDLPLDSTPDHVWQDIFDREWKSSRQLWDRKLFVMGDVLRLVTTADDIEDKLDWVKEVLERTNRGIDEYAHEMEIRLEQIREQTSLQSPEDEKISVDAIRDTLRRRFGTI